jgi:molecular chaperone DnaK (HSP70)
MLLLRPQLTVEDGRMRIRSYHATPKQEILPLVGAAAVLLIARYSYKALQRMDDEWDEYQWQLQQYEKQHGVVNLEEVKFKGGTLAVDMGTVNLVFAHKALASRAAEIIVTREGMRFTFCGMGQQEGEVGQRAYEQYFELPPQQHDANVVCNIELPYRLLIDDSDAAKKVISTVLQSTLTDVLDRTQTKLDQVRPVIVVPPHLSNESGAYGDVLGDTATTYIPEPVAGIWGAHQVQLLPTNVDTPILVVDVGGHVTTLSVVQKNVVLAHLSLTKFGGETFVQEIMQTILEKMPNLAHDAYALPRVYQAAQAAAAEFNVHTRAHLHIPYIGMDLATKQPQHLEMAISRAVLEQAFQEHVRNIVVPNAAQKLSPHMPPPTALDGLWTSLLTRILEEAHMTPIQVSHILLVGGGAKQSLVVASLQSSWMSLTGTMDRMVVTQFGVRSELVALGAASILTNYHYDPNRGLVRDS